MENKYWNYNPNDIDIIAIGDYKIRVMTIEEKKSERGNIYLVYTFEVSGHKKTVRYNLVFNRDNTTLTNTFIKNICDSFEIEPGNFNFNTWIGKVGAAHIAHKDGFPVVSYFIPKFRQENLEWIEPQKDKSETPF